MDHIWGEESTHECACHNAAQNSEIIQTHPLEVVDFHPLIPQKGLKKLKHWEFQPVPFETFVAGEAPEGTKLVVIGAMGFTFTVLGLLVSGVMAGCLLR